MLTTSNYQILDSLQTSAAVTDKNSNIVFVNQAWAEFANNNGFRGAAFIGRNYLNTCDQADGSEMDDALIFRTGFKSVALGAAPGFEMVCPCHSPVNRRWFKTAVQPLGEMLLIIHTDVTGAITSNLPVTARAELVHDLKTPLNAVIGYADLVLSAEGQSFSHSKIVEIFDIVRTAGNRVLQLVDSTLSDRQAPEEADRLAEEELNPRVIVDEVTDQCRPAATATGIELTARPLNGVYLIADREKLWRILSNLVSNAIKYNKPGGQVIVSMDINNSGGMEIIVLDTGLGIEKSKLTSIFQPYVRDGGYGASSMAAGSGLGLGIVREFAGMHDARLRISSAPNVGTSIAVIFPSWRTEW